MFLAQLSVKTRLADNYRPTTTRRSILRLFLDRLTPYFCFCVYIVRHKFSKNKGALQMRLGEMMATNVEVIGSNASLKEAAAKMRDLEVGLIPVCEGNELKGIL